MLPNRKYTPLEIGRIAWRRRWLLVMPLALGVALVPTLLSFVPMEYRSETQIMVIPQRVPDSFVRATVTERVEDRLPAISAQILSRTRLESIILEFDLYPELRRRAAMEDVVAQFRSDLKGPTIIGTSRDSFTLSYSSRDPGTAQKVVARLASLYLEQNLRDRTNRADSTSLFLETELEAAQRRLVDHERKLEAFRLRYAGQLPSQLAGNQLVIQNTQLQLQNLGESMNRATERRLLLERQIADARSPLVTLAAQGAGALSSGPLTAAQEWENARTLLERARTRYREGHPDLSELERNAQQWAERAAAEAQAVPGDAAASRRVLTPAELERQRRVRDLEADIEVIDRQLAGNRAEEDRLKAILALYKTNVDAVPTRESELAELNRGYDVLKAAHDGLLLKREESKTAANLERGRIGEQFSIIDHAAVPQRPHNQARRFQVMAAGPLAALAFGVLIVGLLELRDSTFRREEDVFLSLSLPVLALIPSMPGRLERRTERWKVIALDGLAISTMLLSAAAIVWQIKV